MRSLKIITLTWNNQLKLTELYNSILPTLEGLSWEWYIKNNSSKDDTVNIVKSWNNPNIILEEYPTNLQNYSEGNNYLFNKAYSNKEINKNDYLLCLNDDIIWEDAISLKNMISILDNDPEIGVVGAKLNYTSHPSIIQHAGVLYHSGNIGTPFHYRAGKQEEERDRKNRYYPIVTGAVLLTRASLFKDIGGLNEKLHWCFDDSYYCLEVQNKGKKIVYCGQTSILHSESFSLKKNPVNKLHFQHNVKTFVDRWHSVIDKSLVEKYSKDPNYALYK